MKNLSIHGLYAITDDRFTGPDLHDKVKRVITGGAAMIQYRNKHPESSMRVQDASALLEICHQRRIPLIINDDIALAECIGANGVHLGKDDDSIEKARAVLGQQAIIGVSCYDQLKLAIKAEQAGADYVAFGSFFPSSTKPDAITAPIEILTQAKASLSIPIVAIGGITPNNAAMLIDAGADAIAVIHGLFAQQDTLAAAWAYTNLFGAQQHRIAVK